MPSTDVYTSVLLIKVAGSPLSPELAALLDHSRVTDAANLPDSFELEFTDAAGDVLTRAGITIGTAITLSVSQNGPETPPVLLEGEVTALDREDVGGALLTRVRGLDKSHRLFRGRRIAAYVDSTIADIVRTVASRAGLTAGRISGPTQVLKHTTQDNVSDWVFLRRLADQAGCTFSVTAGRLDFGPPTDAADAAASGQGARSDPMVIEHGANTLYLAATLTSSEQVPEVEVRGWDPRQKEAVVSVKPAQTRSAELPNVTPARFATAFDSPRYVTSTGTGIVAQQDTYAASLAERVAGGFAELEAHVLGNPRIRSGSAVRLSGFGSPFDGRYTVTESRHEFSTALGYTTTAIVSNASDRSLFGIVGGAGGTTGGSAAGSGQMPGVVSAVVSDITDPDDLGRVQLKFPASSDSYVSGWARMAQIGAGDKRGALVLPEVNDEVLVAFENGRFDRPVVLGGLYNGLDQPATSWGENIESGQVTRRSFTSRTGMVVEFVESSASEKFEISTNDGAQKVTLTQNASKGIEIISEGPVAVTAKTDATVTADSGTITLSGSKVEIKAATSLRLSGATVEMAGTSSVDVKAAAVTVKGDATAELSAGAMTTVKGAMVKIN